MDIPNKSDHRSCSYFDLECNSTAEKQSFEKQCHMRVTVNLRTPLYGKASLQRVIVNLHQEYSKSVAGVNL